MDRHCTSQDRAGLPGYIPSQEGNGQRAESAAQLRRHGTKEGFQPGVLVHKHKREGLDNPDGELVLNGQFVELVPLELGQHGGLDVQLGEHLVLFERLREVGLA